MESYEADDWLKATESPLRDGIAEVKDGSLSDGSMQSSEACPAVEAKTPKQYSPNIDSDAEEGGLVDSYRNVGRPSSVGVRGLENISSEDERWRWTVVRTFFEEKPLFDHQLSSFNDFMDTGLQKVVDEVPVFEIPPDHNPAAVRIDGYPKQARIKFGKIQLVRPSISVKPLKPVVPGDSGERGSVPEGGQMAGWDNGAEGREATQNLDSTKTGAKDGRGDEDASERFPTQDVKGWTNADAGEAWGSSRKGDMDETDAGGGTWKESTWGEDTDPFEKVLNQAGKGKCQDEVAFGFAGAKGKNWGENTDPFERVLNQAGKGKSQDEVAFGSAGLQGKNYVRDQDMENGIQGSRGKHPVEDEDDDLHRKKADVEEGKSKTSDKGKMKEVKERGRGKGKANKKGKDVGNDAGIDDAVGSTKNGKKRKSRKEEQEHSDPEEEDVVTALYPREARLRNLTYAADINIDIEVEIYVPSAIKSTSDDESFMSKGSKSGGKQNPDSATKDMGETILDVISLPQTPLGKVPVMVKSKYCRLHELEGEKARQEDCAFDIGGYFIVKGAEKVLFAQEQPFIRRVMVFRNNLGLTASSGGEYKGSNLIYRNSVFLRRLVPGKGSVPASGPVVCTMRLRRVDGVIPIVIVMRALGIGTDKEVIEIICGNLEDPGMIELALPFIRHADKEITEFLEANGKNVNKAHSQKSALKFIGARVQSRVNSTSQHEGARQVLDQLCPNQQDLNDSGKAILLGYMVYKVCCCHLGRCEVDDRDDFRNKRLDLAGNLLTLEFRNLFNRFKHEMKKRIQKALGKTNVKFKVDSTIVTVGFQRAFSTGEWSAPGDMRAKITGVVAELPRANPMSAHCQLRKMRTQVNYIAKVTNARFLNYSHWGRVCILETPDGENCGLVKSIALATFVSVESPESIVHEFLVDWKMDILSNVTIESLQASHKVLLNGKLVGCHREPCSLVQDMRTLRREQSLQNQVEIVQDKKMKEIRIYTDAGRTLRPLLIVEKQKLKINSAHIAELNSRHQGGLKYLLDQGVLEFLGVEEEEQSLIALDTEELEAAKGNPYVGSYTHCELHPVLLFGLGACVIPFANRNQSSRNMQQAQKHGKQAIGNYTTNLKARSDTSAHQLFYPQTQLVKTGAAACLQKDELVNGQNAIVAIACYSGYNQEDSLIMNKSSVDRGLFRTMHYKTHRSILRVAGEEFAKPPQPEGTTSAKSNMSYGKLDSDGFPYVGAQLLEGEIIAGKVRDDRTNIGLTMDVSDKVKVSNQGWVDQIIQTTEADGTRLAKVRMRSSRPPQIGDKFSSMHGQKGVVGMLFEQEDMPFTQEGIVPDIIINPHAFPSRQTLGQLMESLHGKVMAAHIKDNKEGGKLRRGDATPFTPLTVHDIATELHNAGYQKWGKECMYNGHTGEKMEALISIGPTFYQRLVHMVVDKLKYRGRGYVHPLTRQPVKERDRHGGVKFGEMERDCMIAHGAAMTLRERTFVLSDFYRVYYCKECQLLASMDNLTRIPSCQRCRSSKHVVQLEMPYACKLLHQELLSMGICVRLITEPC